MLRIGLVATVLGAALSGPPNSAAQELPPGGYYADGAYYVPTAPSASATTAAAPSASSVGPPGYGFPIVYVAYTATAVRIQWVSLVGGDAPGFPYVPVYGSQAPC
jgi:hypothetical protein